MRTSGIERFNDALSLAIALKPYSNIERRTSGDSISV